MHCENAVMLDRVHDSPALMQRKFWLRAAIFICFALVASAHAAETILFEKTSLFGTIIVSEDEYRLRTLRFEKGGAPQSVVKPGDPDHLELHYAKVAFVGLALSGELRRALVVGLGGGTLPMFLRKNYPDTVIDAVDIDPDVVYVAKQFFGFSEDERMRAHVEDGRRFIEKVREPYDAIFLDAFGSDSVPPHLTTREFLLAVRRAVKPSGVVVGNLWGPHLNPQYDAMVRTYQEVFDELFILDVRGAGNMILLALPRKQPLSREELRQLARNVSTTRRLRLDLGELVDYGFLHARARNPDARVLDDQILSDKEPLQLYRPGRPAQTPSWRHAR
jgi:spermidine synthase